MLLFLHQCTRPEAQQPPAVWQAFSNLRLPKWDLDFIRRVLWRKLPVGVWMEQMGGNLCPLDGRMENHEHVLWCCMFSPLLFDTLHKAFGLVVTDS